MSSTTTPNKTVFLTGATGFLGSYLLKMLLENQFFVYALARPRNDVPSEERVVSALGFWADNLPATLLKNLKVISGDVSMPGLGIPLGESRNKLEKEIGAVYHCAALVKLEGDLGRMRLTNTRGLENVLEFSLRCQERGALCKVNYVSTAYVAGNKPDLSFDEGMLELGQTFNNVYEQTKYEAEMSLRKYSGRGLDIAVFRPSMVMGDSRQGKTSEFHLFYEPIHFLYKGFFKVFPLNRRAFINLVSVDKVAEAIVLLGGRKESNTYHLVSPEDTNVGRLFDFASNYFNFTLPRFVPFEGFSDRDWSPIQKRMARPFVPYFNYTTKFCCGATARVLSDYGFSFPVIDEQALARVFEYCDRRGFIKVK